MPSPQVFSCQAGQRKWCELQILDSNIFMIAKLFSIFIHFHPFSSTFHFPVSGEQEFVATDPVTSATSHLCPPWASPRGASWLPEASRHRRRPCFPPWTWARWPWSAADLRQAIRHIASAAEVAVAGIQLIPCFPSDSH